MSPLERAIAEAKKEVTEENGYSVIAMVGAGKVISICQRILSEPKTESKWEMKATASNVDNEDLIHGYLNDGYEPFAVDSGILFFKRPVCDKSE